MMALQTRSKSDPELLSMILDLVEAIQSLRHAVQMVSLGVHLPSDNKRALDTALAASEMATKSVLSEVKKVIELDNQPKNEP